MSKGPSAWAQARALAFMNSGEVINGEVITGTEAGLVGVEVAEVVFGLEVVDGGVKSWNAKGVFSLRGETNQLHESDHAMRGDNNDTGNVKIVVPTGLTSSVDEVSLL